MPSLKMRFKNKDIVFLYIAANDDKDDEVWRDFIYSSGLTGEHVRRTFSQIGKIWSDIGLENQSYPHYCIFDKKGKLIVKDAKRPSAGEDLYDQLNKALNQ